MEDFTIEAMTPILAKFPPTLVLNSMRDPTFFPSVAMHSLLVKLGVEADLNLWSGQDHCFFYNHDIPESREAWNVIVKFFDKNLGKLPN